MWVEGRVGAACQWCTQRGEHRREGEPNPVSVAPTRAVLCIVGPGPIGCCASVFGRHEGRIVGISAGRLERVWRRRLARGYAQRHRQPQEARGDHTGTRHGSGYTAGAQAHDPRVFRTALVDSGRRLGYAGPIVSDKDERPEDEATAGDASGGSTGASGSDARSSARSSASSDSGSDSGSDGGNSGDAERMDLPKWNRARVKRKQVKGEEQDGFQAGVRKAGKTALTQAPVVIGAIVVVAGIIAGVVWYRGKVAEDAAAATRVLASATAASSRARIDATGEFDDRKLPPPNPIFADEGARAKSIDDTLAELTSEMSDTDAATAAKLVEAARHMQSGKFAEAKAGYEAFLQGQADHPLAFLAHEGLALAMEAAGDVDGAVAQLDTMAPEAGAFYRDQALFHKARMLEGQGKADEALTTYKAYVEEYPLDQDSLARDAVVARLEELAPDLVPADAKKNAAGLGGMGLPPGLGG